MEFVVVSLSPPPPLGLACGEQIQRPSAATGSFFSDSVSEPSAELRVEFSVGVEFRGCAYSLSLVCFLFFFSGEVFLPVSTQPPDLKGMN